MLMKEMVPVVCHLAPGLTRDFPKYDSRLVPGKEMQEGQRMHTPGHLSRRSSLYGTQLYLSNH